LRQISNIPGKCWGNKKRGFAGDFSKASRLFQASIGNHLTVFHSHWFSESASSHGKSPQQQLNQSWMNENVSTSFFVTHFLLQFHTLPANIPHILFLLSVLYRELHIIIEFEKRCFRWHLIVALYFVAERLCNASETQNKAKKMFDFH
jgi:hypothetical protein